MTFQDLIDEIKAWFLSLRTIDKFFFIWGYFMTLIIAYIILVRPIEDILSWYIFVFIIWVIYTIPVIIDRRRYLKNRLRE